jgi:hypothetical protein
VGTYTEIMFHADVSKIAHDAIKNYVNYDINPQIHVGLGSNFWDSTAPSKMFQIHRVNDVAYFAGAKGFRFNSKSWNSKGTDVCYSVNFRVAIKNYQGEIESFFDWIAPHINITGGHESDRFIGYSQKEDSLLPDFLYYVTTEHVLKRREVQ